MVMIDKFHKSLHKFVNMISNAFPLNKIKEFFNRALQSLHISQKKSVLYLSIGIDIENIHSVQQRKVLHQNSTMFNNNELLYCKNRVESFAALICVMESFTIAMMSLKNCPPYSCKDIELILSPSEKPYLKLHGELATFFKACNLMSDVSISYTPETALAVVVIYKNVFNSDFISF